MYNITTAGIFAILILTSASAAQAKDQDNHSNSFSGIKVFAEKESQGSEWDSVTNQAKYMVSYKVTLDNLSNHSIESKKDNKMCFYLFDKNGKSFISTGVQLELLEKYKPVDNKSGMVYFSSTDPEVLTMPFVRFAIGKDCLSER